MKIAATLTALLLSAATLVAFKAPVKKDDVYKVDAQKSSISWIGKKVGGQHSGTVSLQAGTLTSNGSTLKGGNFIINMGSLKCTDITDADYNAKLIGHLKGEDFFGTDKFATSTFVIKKVTGAGANKATINGDLTIKGVTKPISFPATVTFAKDGSLTAVAESVKIDRTLYGIKYKSKSMFANLGDNFIHDEFELNIKLVATK